MSILNKRKDDRNLKEQSFTEQYDESFSYKKSENKGNSALLGNAKLSLEECQKAIAIGDIQYTDEELIKMRDWLDNLSDITLAIIEHNGIDNMNEILNRASEK